MNPNIEKLEEFVNEFDAAFQDGAIFKRDEILRINNALQRASKILNDPFLFVENVHDVSVAALTGIRVPFSLRK